MGASAVLSNDPIRTVIAKQINARLEKNEEITPAMLELVKISSGQAFGQAQSAEQRFDQVLVEHPVRRENASRSDLTYSSHPVAKESP